MQDISIIIPAFNSCRQLETLLNVSCKALMQPMSELIVMDQGGTDNTIQVLANYANQGFIRYIRRAGKSPLGFCGLGAAKAQNKYLLFLKDHIDYPADFFLRVQQQKPASGQAISFFIEQNAVFASQIRSEQKSIQEMFSDIDISNKIDPITNLALGTNGSCLLCRREDLIKGFKNIDSNVLIDNPLAINTQRTSTIDTKKSVQTSKKTNNEDQDYKKAEKRVKNLLYKLINLGFTERAYQDLEQLIAGKKSHKKRLAARELALWHANKYTKEDSQKCLKWLEIAKQGETDPVRIRQNAVLEAECLNNLDQTKKARKVIDNELKKENHADLYLARANLEQEVSAKLIWINKAMSLHGLFEITCKLEEKATFYDSLQVKHGAIKRTALPADAPKVTVIIPAYNAQDTVRVALDSVRSQTWTNLEVLVVDDCSTDNTTSVVKEYEQRDSRVRLIRAGSNAGPYVARNLALKEATGDFITVNDADDWSHPEKIEIQARHLMEKPDFMANMSQWARAYSNLYFYRRGKPGCYLSKNLSSLMFRRKPVLNKAGFWDCVTFAGDSEYLRRIKKIFGDSAVKILNTGPLSFGRQCKESLTGNIHFGFHGAFVGARRAYLEAHSWWHRSTDNPYMDFPSRKRPFPAPLPMKPESKGNNDTHRHMDVVIATDIRLPGGNVASTVEEINAQKKFGLQTGIVPIFRYDLRTERQWNKKILNLIDDEKTHLLVYGENVSCDLLIIRHPPVLQDYQEFLPQIKAREIKVIVNQSPFRDYNDLDSRLYDLNKCRRNMESYFGHPGTWHPIGPAVREALMNEPDARNTVEVAHEDWVNIIDVESWQVRKRRNTDSKPVIGRHARDHYVKWPSDPEQLLAAYPASNAFQVKILGGAESPKSILGYVPNNWTVYPFDTISPKEFLAGIDVFVYFTHPGWVEAFGRTPMEAMAAGVPAILPETFRPLFRDAAIYASPFEVQEIVMQLYNDRDYYNKQSEKGRKFVYENFGYGKHEQRLAQYVRALQHTQIQKEVS